MIRALLSALLLAASARAAERLISRPEKKRFATVMNKILPLLHPQHRLYRLINSATRILFSYAGAAVLHFIWLVTFIAIGGKPPRGFIGGLLWCLAPIVTATGFSYGVVFYDLIAFKIRHTLLSVLLWPLVGCAVGAAAVFPFGPMFIGVAMFILGGFTVFLREAYLSSRNSAA